MLSPNARNRVTASFGGPRDRYPKVATRRLLQGVRRPAGARRRADFEDAARVQRAPGGHRLLPASHDWRSEIHRDRQGRPSTGPACRRGQAMPRYPTLSTGRGDGVAGGNTDDSAQADNHSAATTGNKRGRAYAISRGTRWTDPEATQDVSLNRYAEQFDTQHLGRILRGAPVHGLRPAPPTRNSSNDFASPARGLAAEVSVTGTQVLTGSDGWLFAAEEAARPRRRGPSPERGGRRDRQRRPSACAATA